MSVAKFKWLRYLRNMLLFRRDGPADPQMPDRSGDNPLPCPFCGCAYIGVVENELQVGKEWQFYCVSCFADPGDWCFTKEAALATWNRRHGAK